MRRIPLIVACALLCASCGPAADPPATVTTAVDEGGSMMKNAQSGANSRLAIPGDYVDSSRQDNGRVKVPTDQEEAAAYRAEGQRMLKMATDRNAKEAAERQERVSRTTKITVVPAQHQEEFLTPSEKIAAAKAAGVAKAEARRRYCEAHPVECETLRAAQQTQSDVESLKTSLLMQGGRP